MTVVADPADNPTYLYPGPHEMREGLARLDRAELLLVVAHKDYAMRGTSSAVAILSRPRICSLEAGEDSFTTRTVFAYYSRSFRIPHADFRPSCVIDAATETTGRCPYVDSVVAHLGRSQPGQPPPVRPAH